ncbi:Ppx/GppA phosphatase family protein [Echinicola jeungdonensis]|uniref:Ppx/GppA phosphatase family protein n=1 Tax=Echinicola jeungdonensis TaxID=709343 RepID=A0ABV5J2V2_9BACT|nr:Ppx/GppA phosphatase family protein [Echinicola jeungdonensis]MDN3668479.1 Ppx/GppA phosphatase family protein [Echinicola jeungdonensis]
MNLAAIDIGTNSIHLVIAEVTSRQNIKVLIDEKEMVKLGVGVFATNQLSPEAFDRGIQVIKRYVQLADQYGVDEIITAATSATREAKNGGEFLDRLAYETGLTPHVISGKEEARLIFLAVRRAIAFGDEKVLVLDIGGGSTEATVGNQDEIFFKRSIKLGVLRLFDLANGKSTLNKKEVAEMEGHINLAAKDIMSQAVSKGFSKVIGTSGTIRTLGEAVHISEKGSPISTVNAEEIATNDLEKLSKKLMKLPSDKRGEIPGISGNRVDAIHLGSLLLIRLLQMAKAEKITLCDASLREGLILDYLDRIGKKQETIFPERDLRHRSVQHLALRYNTDLEQKKHVSMLALQLFDQLKGIHQLKEKPRELLEFACLIFEIGHFIGFPKYHKHSRYIISHSRLRGFNNEEILLLGHLARYHRKAKPKKKHKEFKQLDKSQKKIIRVLAGILRIAVGLDKTKNQWIEEVACEVEEDKIIITVYGEENPDLEIWDAMRQRKVLKKALKKEIVVTAASPVPL